LKILFIYLRQREREPGGRGRRAKGEAENLKQRLHSKPEPHKGLNLMTLRS